MRDTTQDWDRDGNYHSQGKVSSGSNENHNCSSAYSRPPTGSSFEDQDWCRHDSTRQENPFSTEAKRTGTRRRHELPVYREEKPQFEFTKARSSSHWVEIVGRSCITRAGLTNRATELCGKSRMTSMHGTATKRPIVPTNTVTPSGPVDLTVRETRNETGRTQPARGKVVQTTTSTETLSEFETEGKKERKVTTRCSKTRVRSKHEVYVFVEWGRRSAASTSFVTSTRKTQREEQKPTRRTMELSRERLRVVEKRNTSTTPIITQRGSPCRILPGTTSCVNSRTYSYLRKVHTAGVTGRPILVVGYTARARLTTIEVDRTTGKGELTIETETVLRMQRDGPTYDGSRRAFDLYRNGNKRTSDSLRFGNSVVFCLQRHTTYPQWDVGDVTTKRCTNWMVVTGRHDYETSGS
ncbi:hypothetical protein K501DRAFT_268398 [Backusella circina FSU 941]|nr:hypothetical protein K501DRAFT_268398 [Backusella circina FSU 941]